MILHFLITVLFIYGVHATTRDGMIFSFAYMKVFYTLTRWMDKPELILKPLFDCTPCMASIYGTISFFVYGSFQGLILLSLVVWVFALCGFNYILNKILNR